MEVGLTVAVKRTASRTVSHERGVGLYRITLQQHAHWFREEKTAQSAPGRGGGEGAAEGWTAWRDPGEGACMGREEKKEEKKKRELHRACGERRCGEIRSLNKCDNKIRATKGI